MLDLLNDCINICLSYMPYYSKFISNNLNNEFKEFIEKNGRTKDVIKKNIDKIKLKEVKLYNNELNRQCVDKCLDILNLSDFDKIERKRIISILNQNYISNILLNLLEEYTIIAKNNKKKVKVENKIILPKIKSNKKNYIYIDNKKYYHIIDNNGIYDIDYKSLENEIKKYEECILNSDILFDNENELSMFEKRRRVYINEIFDLECSLLSLNSFDINKYFECSKLLVDKFFDQIFITHNYKLSCLNKLMNETYLRYGFYRQLSNYKVAYERFVTLLNRDSLNNKDISLESYKFKNTSNYKEFRNIKGLIPNVGDIVKCFNNRIKIELCSNINIYLKNISYYIDNLCIYMQLDEFIELYFDIRNSIKLGINNNVIKYKSSDFIKLQKQMCEYIVSKLNVDILSLNQYKSILNKVCIDILHEKMMFDVDSFEIRRKVRKDDKQETRFLNGILLNLLK